MKCLTCGNDKPCDCRRCEACQEMTSDPVVISEPSWEDITLCPVHAVEFAKERRNMDLLPEWLKREHMEVVGQ